MAGVVHIPWYATVFRGDRLEAALREIAPLALRYGATEYGVYRSRDDAYKFLQWRTFESKLDWERYWTAPEFIALARRVLELLPGAGALRLERPGSTASSRSRATRRAA